MNLLQIFFVFLLMSREHSGTFSSKDVLSAAVPSSELELNQELSDAFGADLHLSPKDTPSSYGQSSVSYQQASYDGAQMVCDDVTRLSLKDEEIAFGQVSSRGSLRTDILDTVNEDAILSSHSHPNLLGSSDGIQIDMSAEENHLIKGSLSDKHSINCKRLCFICFLFFGFLFDCF